MSTFVSAGRGGSGPGRLLARTFQAMGGRGGNRNSSVRRSQETMDERLERRQNIRSRGRGRGMRDRGRGRNFHSRLRMDGDDVAMEDRPRRLVTVIRGGRISRSSRGGQLPRMPVPSVDFKRNEAARTLMKEVLSERYLTEPKFLDLHNLYKDKKLLEAKISSSLIRHANVEFILDVIREHIPDLVGLNLTGNHLQLAHFENLADYAPNLTRLSLKYCDISTEEQLKCIQDVQLRELDLRGNSITQKPRFKNNRENYIRAMQAIFPTLEMLDGQSVPRAISIGNTETNKFPVSHEASFFAVPHVKDIVVNFVQQYYECLDDQTKREMLLSAYHDGAVFSLTCSHQIKKARETHLLNSRNALHLKSLEFMDNLLIRSKISVVGKLSKLPKMQHVPPSMSVFCPFVDNQLVHFSLKGVFREYESDAVGAHVMLRTFSDSFICTIQENGGLLINNHQMSIDVPSREHEKKYLQVESRQQVGPPQPPAMAPTVTPTVTATTVTLTQDQREAVLSQFMAETGMVQAMCLECLTNGNWDYQHAMQLFNEAKLAGRIPAHYFATSQ